LRHFLEELLMKPLIIMPTFNERENLPVLIDEVLATDPRVRMLIVDDGSPDGTGEIADDLARRTGRVHVLHRARKLGLGSAYVAGFKYALDHDYDRVVEMDADFSHRPQDLPKLLEASARADVVVGSRNVAGGRTENWSPLRTLISRGGSLYSRLMLKLPVKDCTSGFKCFSREVLQALDLDTIASNGFGFQVEMNYLCRLAGFQFAEVPIVFPDRAAGRSKMSSGIVFEALALVWRLRVEQRRDPRAFNGQLLAATASGGSGRTRGAVKR
jgi:dolichol-phosphate mannosyltransferase